MRILVNISQHRMKGFTLMEMIMALAIVGIILSIGALQWNGYTTSWNLETEAKKIAANIRQVQQMAILQERPFRIVFNSPDAWTYRVERNEEISWSLFSTLAIPKTDILVVFSGLPYQTETMPFPEQTFPAGLVLTFDKFGAVSLCNQPADCYQAYLYLYSSDGMRVSTVNISNITGTVWIQ